MAHRHGVTRRLRGVLPRGVAFAVALALAGVVGLTVGAVLAHQADGASAQGGTPAILAPVLPVGSPHAPALAAGVVAPNPRAPLAESVPVRLMIPEIGVDTELMRLGLQKDGTMEVPPGSFPAGWFVGAPTPGELGPAVLAGHVDYDGPGVFHDLHRLTKGDLVDVERADGSVAQFVVTKVGRYPKDDFPSEAVYGAIDHAGLRLITCGGVWDTSTGHYRDNVVVFATLATSTRAAAGEQQPS